MSKAKTGQLGPETRGRVLKLVQDFKDLVPKGMKIVGINHGVESEVAALRRECHSCVQSAEVQSPRDGYSARATPSRA